MKPNILLILVRKTRAFILGVIILIFLESCSNEKNYSENKQENANQVIHTFLEKSVSGLNVSNQVSELPYKIATYVNGNCYCGIDDFTKWSNLNKKYYNELGEITIEFFVYSANYYQFEELISSESLVENNFKVYFDKSDEFRKKNKFTNIDEKEAYLLDSNNVVIAKGDFLGNKEVRNEFFNKINLVKIDRNL